MNNLTGNRRATMSSAMVAPYGMNTDDDWRNSFKEVEVFVQVEYRYKVLVEVPQGSTPVAEAIKAMESKPLEHWCDPNFLWTQDLEDVFQTGNVLDCEEAEGYENTHEHHVDALVTAINCTVITNKPSEVIHPLMSLSYLNPCYQGDYKKDGYDEDGNLKAWGAYDCYGGVRTHDDYWDCDCDDGFNYIHKKSESLVCAVCESEEDDSSDSRVNEVAEKFGWDKEEAE